MSNDRSLRVLQENQTFCVLPWIHLCSSVDGVWGRCCADDSMYHQHYYEMEEEPEFRLKEEAIGCLSGSRYADSNEGKVYNLPEAFNSPQMKRTRLAMLAGEPVAACQYCYDLEAGGGKSYRQKAYELFAEKFEVAELVEATAPDGALDEFPGYLDIRFGNSCNLQCIMCCFPVSSSLGKNRKAKWSKAYIDPYAGDTEFWGVLERNVSSIRRIYFAGGEPFLQPLHFKLLDLLIGAGCAKDVELGYNTNLTVLPRGIGDKLKKFKRVEIGASCDGTEAVFERIRVGAKWDVFVENLQKVREFARVWLAVTPQKDNIANLEELVEWAVREGYEIDMTNILMYPEELGLKNLSREEKTLFAGRYREVALSHQRAGRAEIASQLGMIVEVMCSPSAEEAASLQAASVASDSEERR